jgi:ethanolamine utilization protein EutQ
MKEASTMPAANERILLVTPEDVDTWYRPGDRRIFLGDAVDSSNSESMSVGFARYAPGESNEWVVTYDEALIVTRGAFTVAAEDGRETTARAGEIIFLRRGTAVVYSAKDEGAELVYVTYPHWTERLDEEVVLRGKTTSAQAAYDAIFLPSEEPPPATDGVALLRSIYDPLERGESDDFRPFYDAFAENIVLTTSAGEVRGKEAVISYFSEAAATMEYDIFVRPLEYFAEGNRVVQVGGETFRVKATGKTHEADWAWLYDVEDGRITRIVGIQDLSGIADEEAEAMAKAQKAQAAPAA